MDILRPIHAVLEPYNRTARHTTSRKLRRIARYGKGTAGDADPNIIDVLIKMGILQRTSGSPTELEFCSSEVAQEVLRADVDNDGNLVPRRVDLIV